MAKKQSKVGGIVPESRLQELYRRPGFMIRRCHQIAVSIFADECREFDLTTTQYGILYVLSRYPGIDQISLARLLGLDRSTTGMVVARLEERLLLRRAIDPTDKRKRLLELTPAGEKMLARVQPVVRRAQERLFAPFNAQEREMLIALLDRLIDMDESAERGDELEDALLAARGG
ncbi:MAG TPA: MarR family transcriptional regulator [Alphaproteobacteria bacterium]|nr:MarR family transcriptional regulator [Alphaproteobacteria bacterium]